MTNTDLAIKYTDEKYATKKDVMIALNTSLIDPFWKEIVSYRSQYKKILSLTDATKTPYFIVFTRAVQSKVSNLQTKLSSVMMNIASIPETAFERTTIRNEMLNRILKYVARYKGINVNDVAIANIISGHQTNLEYAPLINYYNALLYLERNAIAPANEDRLADYYTIFQGGGELTSFYRNIEITNKYQGAIMKPEQISAPVSYIEKLMDNAFDFTSESVLEYPIRAFAIYFAINAIKPFESDNELLSILMMKSCLGSNSVEKLSAILPFEEIILDETKKIASGFVEAYRQHDLTYLLIAYIDVLEACLNTFTSRVTQIQATSANKNFIQGDSEEFEKEVSDYLPRQTKTNIVRGEVKKEPLLKPVIKKTSKEQMVYPSQPASQRTFEAPMQSANTKDYDALAEDLLESDPLLRPAQAAFYVRHCTVGKYYTIQQYKKATGCVYETARTSMDNLAVRGYYKRESLKNKFIYTPIAKE